ncbi:MAG: alpha/beta fold hydrolase [Nocardioidaceae bacterium]
MSAADVPALRGGRRRASSAVLVLHGGREQSRDRAAQLHPAYLRMVDLYLGLRRQSVDCAVYLLLHRLRGWNESERPDPVLDARWALEQIRLRHGDIPVALLGHSMGGRTAFAVADDPQVAGVCALAPWLPDGEPLITTRPDQKFVIAHGTADTVTSATLSHEYADRLRRNGASIAWYGLSGARHALLQRPRLWHLFAVSTTLGISGETALPGDVEKALMDESPDLAWRRLNAFASRHD